MTSEELQMLCGYSKEQLAEMLLQATEIIRQKNKEIAELQNEQKT